MNKIKPIVKTVWITPFFLCNKRLLHKTHYEVLGLKKDCTTKEVKNAYINLSKKFHPDNNRAEESHGNFVRIAEAYNVLSKPDKRRNYDCEISQTFYKKSTRFKSYRSKNVGYGYDDPSFWRNSGMSGKYQYYEDNYYGVPGLKKLSNELIASLCVLFTIVCAGIQFYTIKHSFDLRQEILMKKSLENEKLLKKIKSETDSNDKDTQILIMERRLVGNKFR